MEIAIISLIGMVAIAVWSYLTVGPSCPDTEKAPEKAPEVMGRSMAGIFGTLLLVVIIFWAVFAL